MNLKEWYWLVIKEKCPKHKIKLTKQNYHYLVCPYKNCSYRMEIIPGDDYKYGKIDSE